VEIENPPCSGFAVAKNDLVPALHFFRAIESATDPESLTGNNPMDHPLVRGSRERAHRAPVPIDHSADIGVTRRAFLEIQQRSGTAIQYGENVFIRGGIAHSPDRPPKVASDLLR